MSSTRLLSAEPASSGVDPKPASLRVLISMRREVDGEGPWAFATLRELGVRSVLVEPRVRLAVGEVVQLRCFLPGIEERINLRAELTALVDKEARRYRATLLSLDPVVRVRLERWLEERLERSRDG